MELNHNSCSCSLHIDIHKSGLYAGFIRIHIQWPRAPCVYPFIRAWPASKKEFGKSASAGKWMTPDEIFSIFKLLLPGIIIVLLSTKYEWTTKLAKTSFSHWY